MKLSNLKIRCNRPFLRYWLGDIFQQTLKVIIRLSSWLNQQKFTQELYIYSVWRMLWVMVNQFLSDKVLHQLQIVWNFNLEIQENELEIESFGIILTLWPKWWRLYMSKRCLFGFRETAWPFDIGRHHHDCSVYTTELRKGWGSQWKI